MERTFNVSSLIELNKNNKICKLSGANEKLEAANFRCHTKYFGLTRDNNVKYVYKYFIYTYLTLADIPDLIVKGNEKVILSEILYYENRNLFDRLKEEENKENFAIDIPRSVKVSTLFKLGKHLNTYPVFTKPLIATNFTYNTGIFSSTTNVVTYFLHNDWLTPAQLEDMRGMFNGAESVILTDEQLALVDSIGLEK